MFVTDSAHLFIRINFQFNLCFTCEFKSKISENEIHERLKYLIGPLLYVVSNLQHYANNLIISGQVYKNLNREHNLISLHLFKV